MPCEHCGDIIICMPTLDHQWISAGECPDCRTWTRFINFAYEWYGVDSTCLRCGRQWGDSEWLPLEFARFARRNNIESAKRAWRRNRDARERA